jgi:hypothetical protein
MSPGLERGSGMLDELDFSATAERKCAGAGESGFKGVCGGVRKGGRLEAREKGGWFEYPEVGRKKSTAIT